MHIGMGLRLTRRSGGGGAAPATDAISDALATRAGIGLKPWLYSTTLFTDTAGTVAASAAGDIIAVAKDDSRGLTPGAEMFSGLILDSWTAPVNVTINSNTTATVTGTTGPVKTGLFTLGKIYQVDYNFSATASAAIRIQNQDTAGSGTVLATTPAGGGSGTILISAATSQGLHIRSSIAGTTDITINSLSVKELPYNLYQQTTLANRPILTRWPKSGKRNLLTATATLSTQSKTVTAAQHTLSFKGTGTVTLTGVSTAGPLIGTGVSNTVSLTFTPTAGSLTMTVSGSVTEAQLELGAARTTYQTVTTAYDITEAGSADCWGLTFDGTNDGMATAATLDLSGSDKVGVFVGLTKNLDVVRSAVEHSANSTTGNGTFGILPSSGAVWAGQVFGTTSLRFINSAASFPAPITGVNTLTGDISGDLTILRNNGVQLGTNFGDHGTGNFANATNYIGARGGSSLYFNGIIWGAAIVSTLTTADATIIADIEAQIADNTPTVTL